MRASPWSLSLLMVILGVSLAYFSRQPGVPTTLPTYIVAGALIAGGGLLALRRPFALWFALGAGLLALVVSLASFAVGRELVPTPPITALMGVLVSARVALALSFETRERHRQATHRELSGDLS